MPTRKITQNDDGLPTTIQAEGDDLFGSGTSGSRPASGDFTNDLWLLDDGSGNFYLQRWDGSSWDNMTVAPPQGGAVADRLAVYADTSGSVLKATAQTTLSNSGVLRHVGTVEEDKGADIASAATLSLGSDGNYFDVTGAVTITAISAKPIGTEVTLHFDSTPQLTHHATNLILAGGTNFTAAAGNHMTLRCYDGTNWREVSRSTTPGGGSTVVHTFSFKLDGKIQTVTKLDGAWIAPRACTITRVTLYRRTAGSSGSTIVDVNKNGTTIYTTQGNRPTVTQAGGNDQIDATTDMNVTAVAQDDRIEVDVDSAEAGNPLDLAVIVEVTFP